VRGSSGLQRQFDLPPFAIEFSPFFKIEVAQTLNSKVVQQVTLFKNAKGSRGFFLLV
jgi:hypothetical protein